MSVISLPAELLISRMRWEQQNFGIHTSGAFGRQTLNNGVPIWAVSIEVDRMNEYASGQWKATLMKLRGSLNQLAVYDVARPVPLGTLRGTGAPFVLEAPVAAGDTTMTLRAGTINTLANSHNLAISPWTQNIGGFWTSAASTDILGPDGQNANVTKFTVGATGSTLFTMQSALEMPAGTRNASLYIYVPSGQALTSWRLGADWQDVETNAGINTAVFDAWVRISVSAVLAATRNALDYNMAFNNANPVGGSGKYFYAAFAKEEPGSAATDYGYGKTLLQGDLLGIGSGTTQQVVILTDDALSFSEGRITVNFEHPMRNAFPAGTEVQWDRPKALFRAQNPRFGWDYESVFASGFALDLLEDPRA